MSGADRILAAIVVVMALVPSCKYWSGSTAREDRRAVPALRTEITLTPAMVSAGDEVAVSIVVENRFSEPVELYFGNQQQFGYVVSTLEGKVVARFPGWFQPAGSRLQLQGYAARSYDVRLETAELAPGRYVLQGGLLGYEDVYPWARQLLVIE